MWDWWSSIPGYCDHDLPFVVLSTTPKYPQCLTCFIWMQNVEKALSLYGHGEYNKSTPTRELRRSSSE